MELEEDQIRTRAYEMWEKDGSPEGRAEEYWEKARASMNGAEADTSPAEAGVEPEEPLSE